MAAFLKIYILSENNEHKFPSNYKLAQWILGRKFPSK